jgi:quercetin dioxygenase-like cupin family protein
MTDLPGVVQLDTRPAPLLIRLTSRDCDGVLGVVEMELGPGTLGPPLHLHPTHGEGFYVLDGRLTVQVDEQIVTGGPGSWMFAPRNTPHTLANHTDAPTRVLCVFAPGGFERRFERMVAQRTGAAVPDALAEAEAATQVLGPPMTLPGKR